MTAPLLVGSDELRRLTDEEIQGYWTSLSKDHTDYLARYDVEPLPRLRPDKAPPITTLQLIILRHFFQRIIHKKHVALMIQHWHPEHGDSQVRHWSDKGWHVLGVGEELHRTETLRNGCHVLVSTQTPHPKFEALKRVKSAQQATDFETVKRAFGYRCATCGSKENEPLRYNPERKTKLEQGHMDPSKSQTPDNIIPQCQDCNSFYADDVVFDRKGRVIALANPRLAVKSSPAVREAIHQALYKGSAS